MAMLPKRLHTAIASGRGSRLALVGIALAGALLVLAQAVAAGPLAELLGLAWHAARGARAAGSGALEAAAAHLRALPDAQDGLAAQATEEGHWRFVNRPGETYTAGTPEELKRVASVLLPERRVDAKLALYLTEDTLFRHPGALKDLPTATELYVVVGRESYQIRIRTEAGIERLFAAIKSNLLVELREYTAFQEAVWQLARPLSKASVRVLALEPGGPAALASSPRIDPASKRALIDVIDPASLPAALAALGGQTVLVTGRLADRLVYVQPASGSERSIILSDLIKAAEEADLNLVVLRAAATPRQPGGRNWLWQKVEVKGLDAALEHASVADFFNAFAPSGRQLLVSAVPEGGRTSLLLTAESAPSGPALPIGVGDAFSGIAAAITGRVLTIGITANMRSAARQQELDQRLLPGIPADAQLGYLLLLLLGLLGTPAARGWWRRVWPPEVAGEYATRGGYLAAGAVRGSVFLLLFLPLTAALSAPISLRRLVALASAPLRRRTRTLRGRAAAKG